MRIASFLFSLACQHQHCSFCFSTRPLFFLAASLIIVLWSVGSVEPLLVSGTCKPSLCVHILSFLTSVCQKKWHRTQRWHTSRFWRAYCWAESYDAQYLEKELTFYYHFPFNSEYSGSVALHRDNNASGKVISSTFTTVLWHLLPPAEALLSSLI